MDRRKEVQLRVFRAAIRQSVGLDIYLVHGCVVAAGVCVCVCVCVEKGDGVCVRDESVLSQRAHKSASRA